jgi:hypothetical protein
MLTLYPLRYFACKLLSREENTVIGAIKTGAGKT